MLRTITTPAAMAGLVLALLAGPALAQTPPVAADHHAHGAAPSEASGTSASPALTEGQITRVDARNGTLTIRHGEITHLGMPPMTMVFGLPDKNQAVQFQPGEQVRFQAEAHDGALRITHIEALR